MVMASATFPAKVITIAKRYIKHHISIRLPKEENATNKNIEQILNIVEEKDKLLKTFEILNKYDLKNNKAIIFCNKKITCDNMESFLITNKMESGVLHSDKNQNTRQKTILAFIKG